MLLAALLFNRCDTSNNYDDPNLKYYTRLIGQSGSQWGVDVAVVPSGPDKGKMYLLGNTTVANSKTQLYIVHTTPEGYVIWTRNVGTDLEDEAKDIELLSDGSIAVLGMQSDGANRDFAVRLFDAGGVMTDSVVYGAAGFTEEAFTISETIDGFIVSGYTTDADLAPANPADAMYVRFYKDLDLYANTWTTKAGGTAEFEVAVKTIEVSPNFYVFGYTNALETVPDAPDYNVFVWVLGASGGDPVNPLLIGNAHIPGSFAGGDEIVTSAAVVPTQSGSGYIISGYSRDQTLNRQQMFSIKVRRELTLADPNNIDEILGEVPRSDGDANSSITGNARGSVFSSQGSGFFVLGSKSVSSNEDIYLKKLDNDLSDAWTSTPFFSFGGVGNDTPGAVAEAPDGRIVVLGTMVMGEALASSQKKMLLMKLSPNGKLGE
jgi:hypothetical protein